MGIADAPLAGRANPGDGTGRAPSSQPPLATATAASSMGSALALSPEKCTALARPKRAIAVNFSAVQFRQRNVITKVAQALSDSGLAPALLEIELTESAIMCSGSDTTEILNNPRRLGIRLAINVYAKHKDLDEWVFRDEIFYVLAGEGVALCNGQKIPVRKGEGRLPEVVEFTLERPPVRLELSDAELRTEIRWLADHDPRA